MITFANPLYFLLLFLLIPFVVWYIIYQKRREPTLKIATTESYRENARTLRTSLVHLPFILRGLAFTLLVVALARPQTNRSFSESETQGIDIMMAMDISTSMLTPDLQPSRIEAAKQVAYEFINNRKNDNIGLTLFGGEAFTQCPLTTNHGTLLKMFRQVSCSMAEHGVIAPGTAVGMGIANAVVHLEKSQAKSKIIIMLTDGTNNTGEISPMQAAELAAKEGIRIYTISVGTDAPVAQDVAQLANGETYQAATQSDYDPKMMAEIAAATGGESYRATSATELRKIYGDIDKLEKSKLKVDNYSKRYEAYAYFAWGAFALLLLEVLLRITWLRRIPA